MFWGKTGCAREEMIPAASAAAAISSVFIFKILATILHFISMLSLSHNCSEELILMLYQFFKLCKKKFTAKFRAPVIRGVAGQCALGRGLQSASTYEWVLAIRLACRLPDGEAA